MKVHFKSGFHFPTKSHAAVYWPHIRITALYAADGFDPASIKPVWFSSGMGQKELTYPAIMHARQ